MRTMVFSDDISIFAYYLSLPIPKLPEHAPSQLTLRPNLPRSPLCSYCYVIITPQT